MMAEYKLYLSKVCMPAGLVDHPDTSYYRCHVQVTGASRITWPRVFIGGKLIGGCDDTTHLQKQGKLAGLIETAKGSSKL